MYLSENVQRVRKSMYSTLAPTNLKTTHVLKVRFTYMYTYIIVIMDSVNLDSCTLH